MSFQEYLNGLTPADRAAMIVRAARSELYLPTLDYCAALTELADLRWYIETAPEPVGSACLDTLAQLLPTLQDTDGSDYAAAILYRYGRDTGRTALVAALHDRADATAAVALGVNHDEPVAGDVIAAFRDHPHIRTPELMRALATWSGTAGADVVLQAYKANRRNIDYGAALSLGGVSAAAPIIQAYLATAKPNDVGRLTAAGALARLGVDAAQQRTFLIGELNAATTPFQMWKAYAARELALAGGPEAEAALIAVATTYTSAPPASPAPRDGTTLSPAELATAAAAALGAFSTDAAANAVAAVLVRITADQSVLDLEQRRTELGVALLRIGVPAAIDAARTQMGDDWMQRATTIRSLRVIPRALVPKSSLPFMGETP